MQNVFRSRVSVTAIDFFLGNFLEISFLRIDTYKQCVMRIFDDMVYTFEIFFRFVTFSKPIHNIVVKCFIAYNILI